MSLLDFKAIPPIAEKIPRKLTKHDDTRVDDYYWLRERENPAVIDYLKKEKAYYNEVTKGLKKQTDSLFDELKSRIKQDDSSVPYFFNGYWYITRFEKEKEYPIYTRKRESMDNSEEILFDCNQMARGLSYFDLASFSVSPDNTLAAFGVDTTGRRMYEIQIKDLKTGKIFPFKVNNTNGRGVWAQDNKHIFYVQKNTETLRAERVLRSNIELPNSNPVQVYFESDETFSVHCSTTKSRQYILISITSTLTTEHRFLNSNKPLGEFQLIQSRVKGLEYFVSQYKDHFYILTNANQANNFKIVRAPIDYPSKENWEVVIPHRENVLLEDLELFNDFIVITERERGLSQLRVRRWDESEDYHIPIKGETYCAYTGFNPQFDSQKLRFGYTSMATPNSIFEFDMVDKTTKLLKQTPILDDFFNPSNYKEERHWASARDGVKIPISLVYHKDTVLSKSTPLLQYAYGSYGHTIDPGFSSNRLSLLNRGFVFAIAHVRGGEYLGRRWYESGKLMSKKNSFNDFIDCSRFLIRKKYTSPEHLYACGGSAGGLLVGAVVNAAPHLYNGAIASVPFVDVVTTMLDKSIPLTTSEYDEWGNPHEEYYYHYMLSYSPYDNVCEQEYPHMYVTTGLHDSQVQYWEPAKWASKLRTNNIAETLVLLDINLESGHGGASGRFNMLKEIARQYAFVLALEDNL
ncbi:MAG: S9 family peptidase [Flavobacteriaceae bacterium]|nr:S9 family peptidase [Flavobacteriaceae bacterium]